MEEIKEKLKKNLSKIGYITLYAFVLSFLGCLSFDVSFTLERFCFVLVLLLYIGYIVDLVCDCIRGVGEE